MSTTPKTNRPSDRAADDKLVDGLTKHAGVITSLFVKGTLMATSDIIALVKTRIDSSDRVEQTKAAWLQAVQADRQLRANTRTVVDGVRQGLQVAFVDSADTLADYGLKPHKARVLTTQQKVAAAAKAKATRAARHTMGSKQKAQIKGTVEVPVTSPTAAAPVAPAPSPAVPAPIAAAPPASVVPSTAGTVTPAVAPAATPSAAVAPKPAS
jgi:hypothetical protein